MEQAVRKWDGDVFRGHEPEAWADLRMIARAQDAEMRALRAALETIARTGDLQTPCYGIECGPLEAGGNRNVCLIHMAPLVARTALARGAAAAAGEALR